MQDADTSAREHPEIPDWLEKPRHDPAAESLTELAYRRAKEALESALDEARKIRLEALEDARRTRGTEGLAMVEARERHLEAAEAEAKGLLRQAEIEAGRIRSEAEQDVRQTVREAKKEAQRQLLEAEATLVEARALRVAADERQREVERLEAEFDATLSQIAERVGIREKPARGWLWRLTHHADGTPKR
jgi:hypothetical protein